MPDRDIHLRVLSRWAKVVYGLAGIELLQGITLILVGVGTGGLVFRPALYLIFAITAHAKRSRGCAITVAVLAGYFSFNTVQFIASGKEFTEPFPYDEVVAWLVLALGVPVTAAAIKCTIAVYRFHRAAGTQIVWRNIGVITVATFGYVVSVFAFVVLFDDSPDDDGEIDTLLVICAIILIIALAIWRKLPAFKGLPAVIGSKDDPHAIRSGSFAGDYNLTLLSSGVESGGGGSYIVSPTGSFGKSFRLTSDQFDSFMTRQKKRLSKAPYIYAFVLPLGVLGGLGGSFISGIVAASVSIGLITVSVAFVIYALARQQREFRQRFPNAPEANRPSGSHRDRFLLGLGAGIPGKLWYQLVSVLLFLCLAVLTANVLTLGSGAWGWALLSGGLSVVSLLPSLVAILGKRRFRERYGLPLTAENLWNVRSGEVSAFESD